MKTAAFLFLWGPILMFNLADRPVPKEGVGEPDTNISVSREFSEPSCEQAESDSSSDSGESSVTTGEEDSGVSRFNETETAFYSRLREKEQQLSQARSREEK